MLSNNKSDNYTTDSGYSSKNLPRNKSISKAKLSVTQSPSKNRKKMLTKNTKTKLIKCNPTDTNGLQNIMAVNHCINSVLGLEMIKFQESLQNLQEALENLSQDEESELYGCLESKLNKSSFKESKRSVRRKIKKLNSGTLSHFESPIKRKMSYNAFMSENKTKSTLNYNQGLRAASSFNCVNLSIPSRYLNPSKEDVVSKNALFVPSNVVAELEDAENVKDINVNNLFYSNQISRRSS